MVTGQMQYGKKAPYYTHIEFSGRADRNFSFRRSDFSEDGQPYIELAYAITVHKAQGSEFGSVILVLPANSRLISREMLYTALTRQKKRIWILHQGPFDRFLALRQYVFSDVAARFTNLLRVSSPQPPRAPVGVPDRLKGAQRKFLEEKLRSRRESGWNLVGVVSGLLNPNDSSVGALDWRPRHDEGYHEGGCCRRRHYAFRQLV